MLNLNLWYIPVQLFIYGYVILFKISSRSISSRKTQKSRVNSNSHPAMRNGLHEKLWSPAVSLDHYWLGGVHHGIGEEFRCVCLAVSRETHGIESLLRKSGLLRLRTTIVVHLRSTPRRHLNRRTWIVCLRSTMADNMNCSWLALQDLPESVFSTLLQVDIEVFLIHSRLGNIH